MTNQEKTELAIKAVQKAKAAFDDYNGRRYQQMLKTAQHGGRLTDAEVKDLESYLAKSYNG